MNINIKIENDGIGECVISNGCKVANSLKGKPLNIPDKNDLKGQSEKAKMHVRLIAIAHKVFICL